MSQGFSSADCVFQEANMRASLERMAFMAVIDVSDYDGGAVAMPLNLPEIVVLPDQKAAHQQLATGLLIGHSTDVNLGDPGYRERNLWRFQGSGSRRLGLDVDPSLLPSHSPTHGLRHLANTTSGNSTTNVTCGGADEGTACFNRGIGCRPSPDTLTLDTVDSVGEDHTWFSTVQLNADGNPQPFGFVTVPYLPFFSNCEGYDSYVSLAKLMEFHPACKLESVGTTVWIDQYPWKDQFSPIADVCSQTDDDVCPNEVLGVVKDPFYGVFLHCYYEESIYQVGTGPEQSPSSICYPIRSLALGGPGPLHDSSLPLAFGLSKCIVSYL